MTPDASINFNDVAKALELYADTIYRVCRLNLRDSSDVDDVFQEVFIRLMHRETSFEQEEHRKAWLCRVAINLCRDFHRSFWRKRVVSIDTVELMIEDPAELDVVTAVQALPPGQRNVIHLHYYEGYSVPEMARILNRKENTLYSDLNRARKNILKQLEGLNHETALQIGNGQDSRD